MILIPKFNVYSKLSHWQDKTYRRLRLLKFVGPKMWVPEDFALAGAYGYQSVSAFPHGTTAASGAYDVGTLALTALVALAIDDVYAHSRIWWERGGNVSENGQDQNPLTEWTDSAEVDVGDYCEVRMDTTTGTMDTWSAGWGENTWITMSAGGGGRNAGMEQTGSGDSSCSGTAYVREIANQSNSVSASFNITASVFGGMGGIFQ